MKKHNLRPLVLAVLGALTLGACNSSTDSDSGSTTGPNLSAKTGVITGFGSVYVNGVEYETGSSSFELDGSSGGEDDLKIGMVVTVHGTVNSDGTTGTATSISYADEVEGVVTAVNIATDGTGTLSVMGQSIAIDATTRFESKVAGATAITAITAGNIVEISGYSDGKGNILATRVELKKAAMEQGDEIELKGLVANHDAKAMTFMIGTLVVNYSAAQLEGFTGGVPANDVYVEVKSNSAPVNNTLTASKVEVEGDGKVGVDGEEGDEHELEGVVTEVKSTTEFLLNGQAVVIGTATRFEHGAASDIINDVKLKVEGTLDANGKLVAEKIEFRHESEMEIEGLVSAIDTAAGTVTVNGQTVKVNNLTIMVDEQDEGVTPVRYFSLSNLAVGDYVELDIYAEGNTLMATKLERDDAPDAESLL